MVVYNVDKNGTISESSESSTGRTPPGSSDLLPPVEEDNADARPIMATDREVGALRNVTAENAEGDKEWVMGSYHINDKIRLFPEETFGGDLKNEFLHMEIGLSKRPVSGGELQGIQMGLIAVNGPVEVMSMGCPMQQVEDMGCVSVEDLDLDTRQLGLQSVSWACLGSIPTQVNVPEVSSGSIAACSMKTQD
ncbi:hypothetical protein Ancab_028492 [Ancistrocladus abbreviatus]